MSEIIEEYVKYGYPSAQKLYELLGKKYKLEKITEVIANHPVYQLYKQKSKNLGGHIIAFSPLELMQADITFMDKFGHQNEGYKYILLCIDVFSRYVWALPLKNKGTQEVYEAFKDVPQPNKLMTDNGSEFTNKLFSAFLHNAGIFHQTALVGDHNALGIVDRMTLTLKSALYKRFIGNDNVKWKAVLEDVVKTYNNTPHEGIYGYTPNEAMNKKNVRAVLTTINTQLADKQIKKAVGEVGDNVRTRKPDWTFRRGYTPKWSEDVGKVEKRVGNIVTIDGKKYKITDIQVVNKESGGAGRELKKEEKKAKVERVLRAEGVSVSNIVTRNKAAREKITFDEKLVGRKVKRKGVVGKIDLYDEEPPYHWHITWENGDQEYFNMKEIKLYLT